VSRGGAAAPLVAWVRRLGVRQPEGRFRLPPLDAATVITLRLVDDGDGDGSIEQLAQLSGEARPTGLSLLAEVNGEPWAALSVDDRQLLADPFHPTLELGSLLTLRLAQLEAGPSPAATPRFAAPDAA
jgi:hypothetical protein